MLRTQIQQTRAESGVNLHRGPNNSLCQIVNVIHYISAILCALCGKFCDRLGRFFGGLGFGPDDFQDVFYFHICWDPAELVASYEKG